MHGEGDSWKWLVSSRDMNTGDRDLKTWYHDDTPKAISNKLTIYEEKVYIPKRSKNKITIYSLRGVIISHIDCYFYANEITAITMTYKGHLIVTQCLSNVVKCISPVTKKLLWTTTLTQPTAVATDKRTKMVHVATEFRKTKYVKVLLPNSGKYGLVLLPNSGKYG